jgi:hypothetical protein
VQLAWIVVLVVLVLASPLTGTLILGAYSLGLVVNLAVGALLFERKAGHIHANIFALRLFEPAKAILAVALLAWSAAMIALVT